MPPPILLYIAIIFRTMKITLSESSKKAHIILIFNYIQDVVVYVLKSTYHYLGFEEFPRIMQEVIF